MPQVKISIIIVHYQNLKELFVCLGAIKKNPPLSSYEVIVVDNDEKNSIQRGLVRAFPKVKYVASPGNCGYGAGNNLGVKQAQGKYLVILNPDVQVTGGAIDVLVNYLDKHTDFAIAAPSLYQPEGGEPIPQGTSRLTPIKGIFAFSFLNKIFPKNPFSENYFLAKVNKNKPYYPEVVSGAAFVIRKDMLDKIGGFDDHFFMFFEESDIGKRLHEQGLKTIVLPEAKVMHDWDYGKSDSEAKTRYFYQSRFYFFKKHYGIINALLVELFARFSKFYAMFLVILSLGIFLRFYRIPENMVFHGELGDNYLAIKNFILQRQIPLIGPPTSHPWLSFGPLFYWLFAPFLALADYNPLAGAFFMAVLSVFIIIINFIIVIKLFDKRTALISSFLLAISPAFVSLAREARFYSLVPLLFYPLWYFLVKKKIFWAGLFFGIMLNFHLSPMILLPGVLIVLISQGLTLRAQGETLMKLVRFLIGGAIPSIPFLIYNLLYKFEMIKNLVLWIPYRVAGFIGLYPKNNVSSGVMQANFLSLYDFLGKSLFPERGCWYAIPVICVFIFLFIELRHLFLTKRIDLPIFSLLVFFFGGVAGIFIHGDPPSHYYLPLYPLPIIFLSLLASRYWKSIAFKITVITFIIFITIMNLRFYFSDRWFYQPQDKITNFQVPYALQLRATDSIIQDADGQKFLLARVGYSDEFAGDYAQNYQYLLWWKGNEPINNESGIMNQELGYTIYENTYKANINEKAIFREDGLMVTK